MPSFPFFPLHLRTSIDDLRRSLIRVLLEVVLEQLAELGDLAGEVGGAGPALLGVEELVRHARARLRHRQVEDVVGLVVDLGQLAAVDGVEDGAGVLEWAALAWLFVSFFIYSGKKRGDIEG